MNSRERIRTTLNYKEPDRIPIDWGIMNIVGITEFAYKNLIEYLGIKHEKYEISDPVQRLAVPCEEVLERFGVDTRVIFPNPPTGYRYKPNENGDFYNEHGVFFKRVGLYADFTGKSLLEDAQSIDDLKAFKLCDPEDATRFAGLRDKAKALYENTSYALTTGQAALLHYMCWTLRGYENYMADLAWDKKFAYFLMDMVKEWNIAFMDKYLNEIGEYIDIMWIADDLGIQNGPFMNPDDVRKYTLPRFAEIIEAMKKKSDAKVCIHSCGSVDWCIPDLIDIGVDILQPVQANAAGNEDSKRIKEMTKGRMTIHGGLDNQGVFHLGVKDVEADVKQKIRDFAPGGGYIFSCGHNIQANCSPLNIMTIFETFKKYCNYPICVD